MSARAETLLWLAQRISAMVLAVVVAVHIGTIIYAVQGGLSAEEIIGRVQGNTGWLAFYGVFVAAVAVHGPIGLRTILREMTPVPARLIDVAAAAFAVLLAWTGWQAAYGLYGFGGA